MLLPMRGRTFRGSAAVAAAILFSLLAGAGQAAAFEADLEAGAAQHGGEDSEALFRLVWIVSGDRRERLRVDDLISSPAWTRTVDAPRPVVLDASKQPSARVRFGARHLPVCLVIARDGSEVGRVEQRECSHEDELLETIRDVLEAARAHQTPLREGAEASPPSRLFWLGYFHWRRGERAEAVRLFDQLEEHSDDRARE